MASPNKTAYTTQYMDNWSFDDTYKQNTVETLGYDGQTLQRINASNLSLRVEYDGSSNPIYIGTSAVGSLNSESKWQIKKLTFDGSGNCTAIQYADGNPNFDNVWDNRASGTYI